MTWDVRSNIKAKPGSQGTLFQGGSDQMTDAKWPRGYTPDRLHEVSSAMGVSRYNKTGEENWETGSELRKAVDTVARSTVPAHHMLGVQFLPGYPNLSDNDAGQYREHPQAAGGKYTGAVSLLQGYADRPTVIHEIGHHVSATEKTAHSAYKTTRQRGEEEAYADNYSQQHYRPRRGEKFQGVGMYNGGEEDHVRTHEFFKAYHADRDYTPIFGVKNLESLRTNWPTPPGAAHPRPPLPGLEKYGKGNRL